MAKNNEHYPVEIFGYPHNVSTTKAKQTRAEHWCPFMDKLCDKQSRLIDFPMGVCSVLHMGNIIPICPNRFLQENIAFADICNEFLGGIDNVLLFPEIGLANVGSFDFVLVKHKPMSSKVEDFCIVEIQSDSTTQTGKLVEALKDYVGGKDISSKRYNYGMNTYNNIKLSYIQMLYKGQVLEKWHKKIIWVCPQYIFEIITKRFNLSNLKYNSQNSTLFFMYDLAKKTNIYKLELVAKKSSSVQNLLTAFTKQPTPSLDVFIASLEGKIKLDVGMTLS